MNDTDYLKKVAERYRKFARSFKHATIRDRLELVAEDFEERARELQRPLTAMPVLRRHDPVH